MKTSKNTHCRRLMLFIILLYASGAAAAPTQGEHMMHLGGGVVMNQGDADTGTAQGEFAYGYMLFPRWEIGFRQLASYSLNDPVEDVWTASTTATVNYYPWSEDKATRFQPFVGGFAGIGYSDVDITGAVGPAVGFKYFMHNNMFFAAQWRYEFYTDHLEAGDETTDYDNGNMMFTLGFGFKWGGE